MLPSTHLQNKITDLILEKLKDSQAEILIIDPEKNSEKHFKIYIKSVQFKGKSRLERSRFMHSILTPYLNSGSIHSVDLILKSHEE